MGHIYFGTGRRDFRCYWRGVYWLQKNADDMKMARPTAYKLMSFASSTGAGFPFNPPIDNHKKKGSLSPFSRFGGEGGIRTLDTRLTYTPLAGERLQPLGHFSVFYSSPSN